MDLSQFSDAPLATPLRLLFLHHSVGGALLAAPGPVDEIARCIWKTHPDGGDARALWTAQGFDVHEASYRTELAENTDLFDWPAKFGERMQRILTCDHNDTFYDDGRTNHVVVFKSCYPNNRFVGEGSAPGDPRGPELTLWNAKAAMMAVRPALERQPETLFVYLTVPPLAPPPETPVWKRLAKTAMGKPQAAAVAARQAGFARRFNSWSLSPDGWLAGYPLRNVAVFDLFGALADGDGLLRYAGRPGDSHPSRAGNEQAARATAGFLARAARRSGLAG
jgi:hypothetical protein